MKTIELKEFVLLSCLLLFFIIIFKMIAPDMADNGEMFFLMGYLEPYKNSALGKIIIPIIIFFEKIWKKCIDVLSKFIGRSS